jgi:thiosulfate/3-mercaptopyruvate sulfurtransferase
MIGSFRNLLVALALAFMAGASASDLAAAQGSSDEQYGHPEWLVDAAWLHQNLEQDDLALVAFTPAEEFVAGHIPGSAQIDWPALQIVETTESSLATWQSDVEALLTDLGIERDDTLVIYDGGSFFAPRLWWILYQLGHEDVRILNGGLAAWEADGGEVQQGESQVEPAAEPYVGEPNDDALVTIDEAEAALAADEALFVDARRFEDEYAVGHIPGAVNVPFMANADATGAWKTPVELRALYEEAGVSGDRPLIVYCSTGVRASVDYFALRQLGFEDVGVFTGSFTEWSSDPDRPVTVGEEP